MKTPEAKYSPGVFNCFSLIVILSAAKNLMYWYRRSFTRVQDDSSGGCHSERSEESDVPVSEILHFVQDDSSWRCHSEPSEESDVPVSDIPHTRSG